MEKIEIQNYTLNKLYNMQDLLKYQIESECELLSDVQTLYYLLNIIKQDK